VAFLPSGKARPAGTLSQADLVAQLNSGVVSWFTANLPVPQGDLVFSLTVSASGSAQGSSSMPLLRLESLVLHYADWLNPPAAR
jgi:hypothetical protein